MGIFLFFFMIIFHHFPFFSCLSLVVLLFWPFVFSFLVASLSSWFGVEIPWGSVLNLFFAHSIILTKFKLNKIFCLSITVTKVSSWFHSSVVCFFKKILIIFDCVESSLLCVGFLSLQWMGAAFVVICRLLIAVIFLVANTSSRHTGFSSCSMGSVIVVHGLGCSQHLEFLDQALNWRALHWQVEFYPLCHRSSPPSICILRHCSRYIQSDL